MQQDTDIKNENSAREGVAGRWEGGQGEVQVLLGWPFARTPWLIGHTQLIYGLDLAAISIMAHE